MTALEFRTTRQCPPERVLSVSLLIPMARTRSHSYTSNEAAPEICRGVSESLQYENEKQVYVTNAMSSMTTMVPT